MTIVGIESEAEPQTERPAEKISAGGKIGKYEIRSQLGVGGMGTVYLAFDPLIEREVALKVLAPEIVNSSIAVQRFLGEARAIGRLNHSHVVSIYDIGQWNSQYFLVMELLSGGSVADRVEQNGRLPWKDACRIIAEAARGLAAAHTAGMIHRDIKPENLMLTKDGAVKVVDFGLSKLLDSSDDAHNAVTKVGQILGTPQYMSPEQFECTEVDARTDVYSLGATFFRLVTGKFPFHDCRSIVQVMTAHLTKAPPQPTELESSIPAGCDGIVARAMAKNPADRYQTTTELAEDLDALLNGSVRQAAFEESHSATTDRPLRSVVVVEPSKLQGAILKDGFSAAGVRSVQVYSSIKSAGQSLAHEAPDLLVTAKQLPDGSGLELLHDLSRRKMLSQTTLVLNSSDSTVEELISVGPAACLILAPKKVRTDDILRVVHAAGTCVVQQGTLHEPIDPTKLRLRVVLDSGRIPDVLADMIRELNLLDVEVLAPADAGVSGSPSPDLTLGLGREPLSAEDGVRAARSAGTRSMFAVVQLDRGKLNLHTVIRNDIIAVCKHHLEIPRLVRLLQGCRS